MSASTGHTSHLAKTRRCDRFPILFASIQAGSRAEGFILNLSELGLCVQTTKGVMPDSPLALRFQSLQSGAWLEVTGQVIWTNESKTLAGIEFLEPTTVAQLEIRNWIAFGNSLEGLRASWSAMGTHEHRIPSSGLRASSPGTTGIPTGTELREEAELNAVLQTLASQADRLDTSASGNPTVAVLPSTGVRASAAAAVALIALIAAVIWLHPHNYFKSIAQMFSKGLPSSAESHSAVAPHIPNIPNPATSTPSSSRRDTATSSVAALPDSAAPTESAIPPAGGFVLQVAAMADEKNANDLTNSLRAKDLPVFVSRRASDRFFKVFVGPYPDMQALHSAQTFLRSEGLKPLEKRWP